MKIIILIVFICLVFFLFSCGNNYYTGPLSDHFDGKIFRNESSTEKKSFFNFLKWQLNKTSSFWPKKILTQSYDEPPAKVNDGELRVSFVGHATVLLQIAGLNILTDPLWSKRASPFSFIGPERVIDAGVKLEKLPKIDLILVSHNHYDHLDLKTLEKIAIKDDSLVIVPLGNDSIIKKYNKKINVIAHDWHEIIEINDKVKIHIEPAQHWSARGLFDRNKALWCAFTIETIYGNIYFAGDTGFSNHFIAAREKHKEFRLALMPIGAFKPEWFMKDSHVNPVEAVQAYEDLNAEYAMAIHYGAFKLADDSYLDPSIEIHKLYDSKRVNPERFKLIDVGKYWFVPLVKEKIRDE